MPHEVALQTLDVSLTMNLGDVSSQCILVINELAPSRVMHFAMQGKKCNRIHRLKDDDDIDQNMFFFKIREKKHTKNTDFTTMLLLLEYLLKRVHIQLMISMLVSNSTSDILYRYHYYHHHLAEFMCDKES